MSLCRFLMALAWMGLQVTFAADVNILWINDESNVIAAEAIEVGLDEPPVGVKVVGREKMSTDTTEVVSAIEQLCGKLGTMIDAGTPPDVIIDSTRVGIVSDVVKTMTWTLGLPTLSTSFGEEGEIREWRDLTPEQENYLVQIRPPADVATGVIRQLISRQNITNAAILFDKNFVMDYKNKNLLLNIPTRHVIDMIKENDGEIRQQLKMLAKIDLNNFFVLGSTETISKVFSVGNSLKLIGSKYSWYGLTKETDETISCTGCSHDKMFMKPTGINNKVSDLRRNFGVEGGPDADIAFYFDTLHLALSAVSSMKEAGTWPTIDYKKCTEYNQQGPLVQNVNLLQSMKSVSASFNYHFAPIKLTSNGDSSVIFDIAVHKLKFRSGSISTTSNIGTWSIDDPDNFKLESGMQLAGLAAKTVYKIVTVLQPPFMMKMADADGKMVYKGYCVDLLDALSELMNFDYEIYESAEGYGMMAPDRSWNGVIKELIDHNADIAVGALSVQAERETVIDFTVPFYDLVGITIMMKKPKVPTSLFKFLTVLENSVWGCILAAYFFTSFLMWVFDKFSPYSYQNNVEKYKDDEEKRFFNFKECLWFCMTSLTPQGGGEAPKNLSGRLVAATWWLFGFIIIASYTANLAAFLTVSRLETPVESLEDLSKQYKIQYSPLNGSSAMVYFERMAYIEEKFYQIWKDMSLNDSTDEYERSKLAVWDYPVSDKYTKMWQSMQEAGLPENLEDAKKRVRDSKSSSEGYAFIGDATDIRYQVLTNCDFQLVGEEFSRKPYALAVQQGSPLKDQLNDAILKLLNQRKLETFKERWWNQNPDKKVCDDEDSDDNGGGISIYNIGGVFIVIFVGIALAVITLIVEYWYYKYKKPNSSVDSDMMAKQLQVKQQLAKSAFNAKGVGFKNEYGLTHRENSGEPNGSADPTVAAAVPTIDKNW